MSLSSLLRGTADSLDRRIGWDKLPLPAGLLTLVGLRQRLRDENLHDTGRGALDVPPIDDHDGYLTARTLDGTFNDLNDPLMGSLGSRFGRNVPLSFTYREPPDAMLDPSPRLVSRELLTREEFQPATTLNLLAGAWIQFEVHDWFSHGKPAPEEPWEIPVADDDPWPEHPMKIPRTHADPSTDPNQPLTYVTDDTHWWDGSQIYGRDPAFAAALRSGENGKLQIDEQGLPPQELEKHIDLTGVAGNFWVGLALLHTLFMREHNAICDELHERHPELTDQELYEKGAPDHRRADGEDPHGRLDAGDHRPPDDGARAARQLVGPGGREPRQALRPQDRERGHPRHPRLADGPPRRALLADRGVRRRLPDAPADPGRLQPPLARQGRAAARAHARGPRRAPRPRAARRDADGGPLLLVRHLAPRRDRAPQLPALPADVQPRRTGRRSTSPRRTSCARESAASRATTSSAGSST